MENITKISSMSVVDGTVLSSVAPVRAFTARVRGLCGTAPVVGADERVDAFAPRPLPVGHQPEVRAAA